MGKKQKYLYLPAGNLTIKQAFYGLRYQTAYGHLTRTPLGLQALVDYLGSKMWININEIWLDEIAETPFKRRLAGVVPGH